MVIESIFAWPGVGRLIFDFILVLDRPVIMAYLLMSVVFFIALSLRVEDLYTVLDPRVRLNEQNGGLA